jgi:integral membrane protein
MPPAPPPKAAGADLMTGALMRYRVVAWIVSVLLIVLFCVGIPLQYAANQPGVDKIAGVAHGVVFYPLYLILTLDLARRVKMPPVRLALTLLAGTVPFLSFVAERETTKWVRGLPEAPVLADTARI